LLIKVLTSVISHSFIGNSIRNFLNWLLHILDELFSWAKLGVTAIISATILFIFAQNLIFALDSCIILKIKLQVNEIIT